MRACPSCVARIVSSIRLPADPVHPSVELAPESGGQQAGLCFIAMLGQEFWRLRLPLTSLGTSELSDVDAGSACISEFCLLIIST